MCATGDILDLDATCDHASLTMEELDRVCCICGYHVLYKEVGKAAVDEVLSCEREARNTHDRYAVVLKITAATDIFGHFRCVNYSLWKIFRKFNFRSCRGLRKYFNN